MVAFWDGVCGIKGAVITHHPASWHAGHPDEAVKALRAQIPCKWERLGDIALLPSQSFASPVWASLGSELWEAVAAALGVARLARQSSIANTGVLLCSIWNLAVHRHESSGFCQVLKQQDRHFMEMAGLHPVTCRGLHIAKAHMTCSRIS